MKNLIGQKFNRLTILSVVKQTYGRSTCLCLCDCGKKKEMLFKNVKAGKSMSCGCLISDRKKGRALTHGLSKTNIYAIY